MKIIRKFFLVLVLIFLFLINFTSPIFAETKTSEFITTTKKENITVIFTFETEVVDITFVSPSGIKKSKNDSDVDFASGDLWASYRINNAEIGTWSVQYDLGNNSSIKFSIIDENYTLSINNLTVKDINDNVLSISFNVNCLSGDIDYKYELYAITQDESENKLLQKGDGISNTAKELNVDLSNLNSGKYSFYLDVYHMDESGGEIFDSASTDEVEYSCEGDLNCIDNFAIYINKNHSECKLEWQDFYINDAQMYRVVAIADEENIYDKEVNNDVFEETFSYPADTNQLVLKLAYKEDEYWSAYKIKNINLNDEYLSNESGDIVTSFINVSYLTKEKKVLKTKINDVEDEIEIENSGNIKFNLDCPVNSVYMEFEGSDLTHYIIDETVYIDDVAPTITLFDEIDGKTIYEKAFTLIGKVNGASSFLINGETIDLNENSIFYYDVKINSGENKIEMLASDINGNETSRIVTIYGNKSLFATFNIDALLDYFPAILSLFISLTLVLLLANLNKSKNNKNNRWLILLLVCCNAAGLFLIYQFVKYYKFNNSPELINLADETLIGASKSLRLQNIFGICSLLYLIVIASIILVLIKRSKKNKKNDSIKNN